MAGRPVADNTPYAMPVVNPILDLLCSHQQYALIEIPRGEYARLLQPMEYQQTLQKAFTVAGIGLHSGDFGKWSCYLSANALQLAS